ncbi:MAG: hypothetical protein ACRDOD_14015, partial [Streptosporangiaceae bacterium]
MLSLQRAVGNRAVAALLAGQRSTRDRARREPAVQRYVEEGYVTGTWKQADDLTVATKEGYP